MIKKKIVLLNFFIIMLSEQETAIICKLDDPHGPK